MTEKINKLATLPDRHTMISSLASHHLNQMDNEQILRECPLDYGAEITPDHLNFVWDSLYTEFEELETLDLAYLFEQLVEERRNKEIEFEMFSDTEEEQ